MELKNNKSDHSEFGVLSMSEYPLRTSIYEDKKITSTNKHSESAGSPDSFVIIQEEDYDFKMLNMSKKNGSTKYICEEVKSILEDEGEDSLEKLQIQY